MKVGEKLKFKKFNWVIVSVEKSPWTGEEIAKYRVQRKYFKSTLPLYYTELSYPIMAWRWNFLKQQLKKDKNYHYNMHLWSNCKRK